MLILRRGYLQFDFAQHSLPHRPRQSLLSAVFDLHKSEVRFPPMCADIPSNFDVDCLNRGEPVNSAIPSKRSGEVSFAALTTLPANLDNVITCNF